MKHNIDPPVYIVIESDRFRVSVVKHANLDIFLVRFKREMQMQKKNVKLIIREQIKMYYYQNAQVSEVTPFPDFSFLIFKPFFYANNILGS